MTRLNHDPCSYARSHRDGARHRGCGGRWTLPHDASAAGETRKGAARNPPRQHRWLRASGRCRRVRGALTTFSTWTVDTVRLIRERRYLPAAFNIAGTTVLAVGAATTGYLLAR